MSSAITTTADTVAKDIVIIGGGIAGLWLLNRLVATGYDAVLLDNAALGSGQTMQSQGMIHGGMKYALRGAVTGASEAIASMPARWRACLEGEGEVDLRGETPLSRQYYLWPTGATGSNLAAFLGSKLLAGRVRRLQADEMPAFFQQRIPKALYQLNELVLDVPALVRRLAQAHQARIHRVDWQGNCHWQGGVNDATLALTPTADSPDLCLKARRFVLAAGQGNAGLLRDLALTQPAMQLRPLHMLMVKHRHPHPLYLHCVEAGHGATPAMTITSHRHRDGDYIWYLGGSIAEQGVGQPPEVRQQEAAQRLRTWFPWLDLDKAQWQSLEVARAEPAQADGGRPDHPFVASHGNIMVTWPVKLTLAPALADDVLSSLAAAGIKPASAPTPPNALARLPFPGIAPAPWEVAWP